MKKLFAALVAVICFAAATAQAITLSLSPMTQSLTSGSFNPGDVSTRVGNGLVKHFSPDSTLLDTLKTGTGSTTTTIKKDRKDDAKDIHEIEVDKNDVEKDLENIENDKSQIVKDRAAHNQTAVEEDQNKLAKDRAQLNTDMRERDRNRAELKKDRPDLYK